jgi:hypothetical protein
MFHLHVLDAKLLTEGLGSHLRCGLECLGCSFVGSVWLARSCYWLGRVHDFGDGVIFGGLDEHRRLCSRSVEVMVVDLLRVRCKNREIGENIPLCIAERSGGVNQVNRRLLGSRRAFAITFTLFEFAK